MKNAICAVGNSSSFIREASFLGTPSVIVGDRQEGREHGGNVMLADYDTEEIARCLEAQIAHGRYESETISAEETRARSLRIIWLRRNCPSIRE